MAAQREAAPVIPAPWAGFVRRQRAAEIPADRAVRERYAEWSRAGLAPAEWAVDIRCNHGHSIVGMTLVPSLSGSGQPLLLPPAGRPPHKRDGHVVYDVGTGRIGDDSTTDDRLIFSCPEPTHERKTRFEVRQRRLIADAIRAAIRDRHYVQLADTPVSHPR